MNNQGRRLILHISLFLLSVLTTLMTGAELITGKIWFTWGLLPDDVDPATVVLQWTDLGKGWVYSLGFLSFLTFHEFGHYFTAIYHRVKSSLPYYIPFYIPLPGMVNIGSMGAVIRLHSIPETTRKFFDIGVAGPLAGFVVSLVLLYLGFTNLPPMREHILNLHPEYLELFGDVPTLEQMKAHLHAQEGETWALGSSLLFDWMKNTLPADPAQVPPDFELMHYPLIFVGYITLFFTALNLLPIGQLDGGHVTYGLFGRKNASVISRVAVVLLVLVGGTGWLEILPWNYEHFAALGIFLLYWIFILHQLLGKERWLLIAIAAPLLLGAQVAAKYYFPEIQPNLLWLVYSFMVVRFLGVDHPPAMFEIPLTPMRKVLGWLAVLIFLLCFTPSPLIVIGG